VQVCRNLTGLYAKTKPPRLHRLGRRRQEHPDETKCWHRWAADGYRGAERVFGWTFYSQGRRGACRLGPTSSSAEALVRFGDEDPTQGRVGQRGAPWPGCIPENAPC